MAICTNLGRTAAALCAAAIIFFALLPAAPATATSTAVLHFEDKDPDEPIVFAGRAPIGFALFEPDLPVQVAAYSVRVSSTSDPAGISVLASRENVNDSVFFGEFHVSSTASDAAAEQILASDGDQLSVTYLEAEDTSGKPRVHVVTGTWRAVSATPDRRQLTYVRTAVAPARIYGGPRAVTPDADVLVYPAEEAPSPVAMTRAAHDGSFEVSLPGAEDAEDVVWLATQEPGLEPSARLPLEVVAVTGRLVAPEPGAPGLESQLVSVRDTGCAVAPCPGATLLTDASGRFKLGRGDLLALGMTLPADLTLDHVETQGAYRINSGAWDPTAYGQPAPVSAAAPDEATVDFGDVAMAAPHLIGRVSNTSGVPLVGADARATLADTSERAHQTREDGRFALTLPDGTHRLVVTSPRNCAVGDTREFDITVVDSVATPDEVMATFSTADAAQWSASLPVAAGVAAPDVAVALDLPGAPVELGLHGAAGSGRILAGCPGEVPDSISPINSGVALSITGVSYTAAEVCIGYADAQAEAVGTDEADLDLVEITADGSTRVLTTQADTDANEVCGVADGSVSPGDSLFAAASAGTGVRRFVVGAHRSSAEEPPPTGGTDPVDEEPPGDDTQRDTSVRLALSRSRVRYGGTVSATAALTDATNRVPVAGETVILSRRPAAGGRWIRTATATTRSDGSVTFAHSPRRNTEYRVRFRGSDSLARSTSRARTVKVSTAVSARLDDRRIRRGQAVSITGAVASNHRGHQVLVQRKRGGTWETVTRSWLSPKSRYTAAFTSQRRGTFALRVLMRAHNDHARGTSRVLTLTVR